jgi:hypothetical protein
MTETSERQDIIRIRSRLLGELIDEHDRGRRKETVAAIRALDKALDMIPSAPEGFARFKDVRSAIKQFLTMRERAAEPEEICEALWRGGFRREPNGGEELSSADIEEHTKTRIRKSIGFHIENPRGIAARVFKSEHGLVGLWSWDRERFKCEKERVA